MKNKLLFLFSLAACSCMTAMQQYNINAEKLLQWKKKYTVWQADYQDVKQSQSATNILDPHATYQFDTLHKHADALTSKKFLMQHVIPALSACPASIVGHSIAIIGHEYGHALAAVLTGVTTEVHFYFDGPYLTGYNKMPTAQIENLSMTKEILIFAAGPICGALTIAGLYTLWKKYLPKHYQDYLLPSLLTPMAIQIRNLEALRIDHMDHIDEGPIITTDGYKITARLQCSALQKHLWNLVIRSSGMGLTGYGLLIKPFWNIMRASYYWGKHLGNTYLQTT